MAQPQGVEYGIPAHKRPSRRPYRIWNAARQRAKKTNIPFTITKEWLDARLAIGVCAVTHLALDMTPGEGKGNTNPWVPSLDQIKAGEGYTPENTRVVCWMYNCAKNVSSDHDVMAMASALVSRGH